MSQIRDDLKVSNKFIPDLSFNQVSFGSLCLKDYFGFDPFNSSILTENQSADLINLCKFSPNDKWSLLYRGSRDGFLAKDFHEKCDGHSKTLTIFKAIESSFIFGGFTSAAWDSIGQYKSDPTAFIFSLTNEDKQPFKSKIRPDYHDFAIYCSFDGGPSFGIFDITIRKSFNTYLSSSDIGNSYFIPLGNIDNKFVLAGSYEFLLSEIEVYKKE